AEQRFGFRRRAPVAPYHRQPAQRPRHLPVLPAENSPTHRQTLAVKSLRLVKVTPQMLDLGQVLHHQGDEMMVRAEPRLVRSQHMAKKRIRRFVLAQVLTLLRKIADGIEPAAVAGGLLMVAGVVSVFVNASRLADWRKTRAEQMEHLVAL